MNNQDREMNDDNRDEQILQMLKMLSQLPEAPVPDEFDLRWKRALRQEMAQSGQHPSGDHVVVVSGRKSKKPQWKRWTAVAACLMVGLLSVQMIRSGMISDLMSGNSESSPVELRNYSADKDDAVSAETEPGEDELSVKGRNLEVATFSLEDDGETGSANDVPPAVEGSGKESQYGNDAILSAGAGAPDNSGASDNSGAFDAGQSETSSLEPSDSMPMDVSEDQRNGGEEGVSRGETLSQNRKAFDKYSEQAVKWLTESIQNSDAQLLVDAITYKNSREYSVEEAERTLALYGDLFDVAEQELTYKRVNITAWSYNNVYRISDGTRDLLLLVSTTADGLEIAEPVLNATDWLYEQLVDEEFTLLDVLCNPDNNEVEFRVRVKSNDGTADDNEIRSLVWKETESLS